MLSGDRRPAVFGAGRNDAERGFGREGENSSSRVGTADRGTFARLGVTGALSARISPSPMRMATVRPRVRPIPGEEGVLPGERGVRGVEGHRREPVRVAVCTVWTGAEASVGVSPFLRPDGEEEKSRWETPRAAAAPARRETDVHAVRDRSTGPLAMAMLPGAARVPR